MIFLWIKKMAIQYIEPIFDGARCQRIVYTLRIVKTIWLTLQQKVTKCTTTCSAATGLRPVAAKKEEDGIWDR
mgnify:CR=1 FL=1